VKLLVTGGSGFLGGYVLREASRRGHHCVALARSQAAAAAVSRAGAQPLAGDLDDAAQIADAFAAADCEVLVNLASLGFGHAPATVAAAERATVARAVFVSTTAVTTRLAAPSRTVRLAAERQIRESALDWTILRPTMIYGAPGDRNLCRLLDLLRRAPVLPVPGGGARLQQPVHVADLAAAVLTAAERPAAIGRTYDVAGPEPLTFTELLRTSAAAIASRTRFLPVPLAPAVAAVRGYERLSRRPRISAEQLLRLAEDKAFAIDAAVSDLGYEPRPFADGIKAEARAMGLAA
jgi:uncharacterized protein YbjT (DUF2867 family)